MTSAIYPGSFDPVTFGHIDIIKRASKLFDSLTVSVLENKAKSSLFSADERVKMLKESVKDLPNVRIESFGGLLIDYCKENQIHIIIRGLRAVTDFEYELQIAQTNRVIAPDIDTVFLTTNLKYSYLSSSIVKEIASYDGDIHSFIDPLVEKEIRRKIRERQNRNE